MYGREMKEVIHWSWMNGNVKYNIWWIFDYKKGGFAFSIWFELIL